MRESKLLNNLAISFISILEITLEMPLNILYETFKIYAWNRRDFIVLLEKGDLWKVLNGDCIMTIAMKSAVKV